jgi:hypothetical protein
MAHPLTRSDPAWKKTLRAGKRRAAKSKPGTDQTKMATPEDPIPLVAIGAPYTAMGKRKTKPLPRKVGVGSASRERRGRNRRGRSRNVAHGS